MKKRHTLYFLCFFILAFMQAMYGQDLGKDFKKDLTKDKDYSAVVDKDVKEHGTISEEVVDEKRNEYLVFSLEHRKQVFSWQLQASKWIFVIVMLIVISGLVLSYMHFYKSLKNPASSSETSNLDMSASGIKMTSSVIGLMILVLAIAFLYLYLIHVFPISEFNIDNSGMK